MPRTNATRRLINNLVINGDFEYAPAFVAATTTNSRWIDGTAAGSLLNADYKWALFGTSGAGVSAQFDTNTFKNGLVSLKLSTTGTGQFLEVHNIRTTTTNGAANIRNTCIPVQPSTAYTYSFWVKANVTSGDSNDGAFIAFREFDANNNNLTGNNSTKVKVTQDWTLITGSFTTNANTRFIDIRPTIYGHTGTGTLIMDAWFDDIQLGKTTPQLRSAA